MKEATGLFPGLGDDGVGERVVRQAWGVTQLVITPEDITIARVEASRLEVGRTRSPIGCC